MRRRERGGRVRIYMEKQNYNMKLINLPICGKKLGTGVVLYSGKQR